MRAIVLAGGFGTRLRAVVSDVPKPMAPIGDIPFLAVLLKYLEVSGFNEVVLSVGYLGDKIQRYFGNKFGSVNVKYSFEDTPLGTGGGIYKALSFVPKDDIFVLNGDTFIGVDFRAMLQFHQNCRSEITIALKPLQDVSRYGCVKTDKNDRVVSFEEKGVVGQGQINAGVYLMSPAVLNCGLPEAFSFERDFLAAKRDSLRIFGYVTESFFIDIGVPEDYLRAQTELPRQLQNFVKI